MNITWEPQPEGYKAMNGPHLVARLTTRTHKEKPGVNGFVVVWEDMKREDWSIHFAAANLPLALVQATLASLPSVASPASS